MAYITTIFIIIFFYRWNFLFFTKGTCSQKVQSWLITDCWSISSFRIISLLPFFSIMISAELDYLAIIAFPLIIWLINWYRCHPSHLFSNIDMPVWYHAFFTSAVHSFFVSLRHGSAPFLFFSLFFWQLGVYY